MARPPAPSVGPARATEAWAIAAAATSGMLVGAGIVATRFVIAQTHPVSLALLRYGVGLLCLLPVVAFAPRVRFRRQDVLPMAALGVVQFGVLIVLLNFGLERIPASLGALIFATFPLLTMLFAALLHAEPLQRGRSAGVAPATARLP